MINYLAVFVCGVASMVIGFIWYGPLFGKTYMKIMGADSMSAEQKAQMRSNMWIMYLIQFVLSIITIIVLDYAITILDGFVSGLAVAILVWFGFVMTTSGGSSLWSGKSSKMSWKLFFISSGAQLISFTIYGLILSAWK